MKLVTINLDDYQPHPKNPNLHPNEQIEELGDSLKKFGQYKNVVIWNNFYLAGHGLVDAAKQRGDATLEAVDVSHLDEAQALALMAADNRLPELAVMDTESLKSLLSEFDNPADIPGFTDDFLRQLKKTTPSSPEDFQEIDENLETNQVCPSCGYQWSE